jgi:hypothetical protein
MRAELSPVSGAITSMISTSNEEISVPRITDRPVHRIPGLTSESGMIGSAAFAAGAATSRQSTGTNKDRRSKRIQGTLSLAK